MKHLTTNRWDKFWVHGLVTGRWPAFLARWVRTWVKTRPGAQLFYEEMMVAGNLAGQKLLSKVQQDSIEDSLFSSWEETLQQKDSGQQELEQKNADFLPLRWASGMAAVGMAVAAFFWVSAPNAELTARGGNLDDAALGIELACLSAKGNSFAVTGKALIGVKSTPRSLRCTSSSVMTFTGTNLRKNAQQVFVLGIGAEGEVHWLPPFSEGSQSILLNAGEHQRTLDEVVDLASLKGKELTVYALFNDEPMEQEDIAVRILAVKKNGIQLQGLARLPLDVKMQNRMQLEIFR